MRYTNVLSDMNIHDVKHFVFPCCILVYTPIPNCEGVHFSVDGVLIIVG
jgi:hypothetical protein